jgi:hypothetical protein
MPKHEPDPKDYAEEKQPFDDVMRKILKAKPQRRNAEKATKPKKTPKKQS